MIREIRNFCEVHTMHTNLSYAIGHERYDEKQL